MVRASAGTARTNANANANPSLHRPNAPPAPHALRVKSRLRPGVGEQGPSSLVEAPVCLQPGHSSAHTHHPVCGFPSSASISLLPFALARGTLHFLLLAYSVSTTTHPPLYFSKYFFIDSQDFSLNSKKQKTCRMTVIKGLVKVQKTVPAENFLLAGMAWGCLVWKVGLELEGKEWITLR